MVPTRELTRLFKTLMTTGEADHTMTDLLSIALALELLGSFRKEEELNKSKWKTHLISKAKR